MYQQLVGYLLSVAVTQPPKKKLRHARCRLSTFSVSLRCNIFSVLLQSYLGVRADPTNEPESDTSTLEVRAETPTLEPLFALPTTTGIPAVPFYIRPRSPKALLSHWGVGGVPSCDGRFRFYAACGCSVSASRLNDHRTIGCRVGRIIGSEGRPDERARIRHIDARGQSRNTDIGAVVRTTNNNRDL